MGLNRKIKKIPEATKTPEGPKLIESPAWLGMGYNVCKGNPKVGPSNGQTMDSGFTTNIFQIDFGDNKNETPDKKYILPLGFKVQPVESCSVSLANSSYQNKDELKKELKGSLGLSGAYQGVTFGMNAEFRYMSNQITSKNRAFIEHKAQCAVYRAYLSRFDPPKLTDNFVNGLLDLNKLTFATQKAKYFQFIETFGTHYIYQILMGSKFSYMKETTKEGLEKIKEKSGKIGGTVGFNPSTPVNFSGKLKGSFSMSKRESQKDSEDNENETRTVIGVPLTPDMKMQDWLNQTQLNPLPISYQVREMYRILDIESIKSDLATKNVNVEQVYKNLKEASENYGTYLLETGQIERTKELVRAIEGEEVELETEEIESQSDKTFIAALSEIPAVDCGPLSALMYAQLIRATKIFKYKYKCFKSPAIKKCLPLQKTTEILAKGSQEKPFKILGTVKGNNSDSMEISCDKGHVLNSFKLYYTSKNTAYYGYTCCQADFEANSKPMFDPPKYAKNNLPNKVSSLNGLEIDGKGEAILSFSLVSELMEEHTFHDNLYQVGYKTAHQPLAKPKK